MFEEKKQQEQGLLEMQDIFSETEKNVNEQPKELRQVFDFEEKKSSWFKKIIIIFLAIMAIAGLSYGAYWGYGKFQSSNKDKKSTLKEPENANQEKEAEFKIPSLPEDSDNDGLINEEELKFGTNLNAVDTDGDGLSDREEVKVYKTNPLKPDTDGDGYLDGQEVRYNYDPLDPAKGAKLRDLKAEINKIK